MLAPAGTIVKELFRHIAPLFTVMVGEAFTDTVITAVLEPTQPLVVPVIEYEVVAAGVTVKLLPVIV